MLKMKNVSKKHWFDSLKWDMVVIMYGVLLNAIKVAFVAIVFIHIFANEITMIENTQWLSIHLYMVLFYVETIVALATFDNVFGLMV
jgi:hypothetical protein